MGVATVSVAAPAFAQIPVPTVQVPVPVPTVQVPVPVPTVQVPVPVPTVKAPVPVPTVQAPVPVPTVQVPKVPVPDVPVPAVPPVGGSGGSSGSSGGSAGGGGARAAVAAGRRRRRGGSARGGSAGGGSSGGGAAGGGSAGGGGATGGGSDASRTGSSPGAGGSANPRSSTRSRGSGTASAACRGSAQSRECILRETVARSTACLDALSSAQRRVLMLRAGVGAGPPRSRGGVAKKLRISERRVVRLERTGLSRLRSLARQGACATPTGTATAGDATPLAASAIASTTLGVKDSPRGTGGSGGGGRPGSPGGGDDDRGGTEPLIGPQRSGGVAGISATNPTDSIDLTVPLLLVIFGLGTAGIITLLRRRAVPAAVDEPPVKPVWIPWRRSTMDGPRWTADPPPSGEDADGWAAAPGSRHEE